MHPQEWLQLCQAQMPGLLEASGAELVALQGHWTSAHSICFEIGLEGTLHKGVKDSKGLELVF
jgi:hypothetical protein